MRPFLFPIVMVLIMLALLAFQNNKQAPSSIINARLQQEISTFQKHVSDFSTSSTQKTNDENNTSFKSLRLDYKKIESYFIYMYPGLNKSINGAPVPSFHTDVVKGHVDLPTGLQVIEELLQDSIINHASIKEQCWKINLALNDALNYLKQSKIHDWEILEANRMELVQLATVAITGFDSPILKQSIDESKVVLQQLSHDVKLYYRFIPASKKAILDRCNNYFSLGLEQLNQCKDFNSFDRFSFTKEVIEPLFKIIGELHIATGYEQYHEVNHLPRGFNHSAEHIFSADFLNAYYSARGVQQPSKEIINLGRTLFFDPILSQNNKRACASCHQVQKGFGDGERKSRAFDFKGTVNRNSLIIINAAYQNNFFWDMRSEDLNNQINFVAHSEKEFNTTFDEIVGKVGASKEYREMFNKAFPHSTSFGIGKIKEALSIYIRSITAMNAPFDQYMRNEKQAPQEVVNGYNLFMGKAACGTCHFAPAFNGTVPPHFNETEGEVLGVPATKENLALDNDQGRFARYKDRYPNFTFLDGMFKTPTLRNITLTAPYMHNGCYDSLEEVVDFYNKGGGKGLGFNIPSQTLPEDELQLTPKERDDIISFLAALTDTSNCNSMPQSLPRTGNKSLDERIIGGEY